MRIEINLRQYWIAIKQRFPFLYGFLPYASSSGGYVWTIGPINIYKGEKK